MHEQKNFSLELKILQCLFKRWSLMNIAAEALESCARGSEKAWGGTSEMENAKAFPALLVFAAQVIYANGS